MTHYTPKQRAQKTAYRHRWQAQHRAEAAVMIPKGWRWSTGGRYWIPDRSGAK